MTEPYIQNAYSKFGIDTKDLTFKRLQVPRRTKKDEAKYKPFLPGEIQADLQFWNNDGGYKYLLVAVDIVTKAIDVVDLDAKTPDEIIRGFNQILYSKTHPYIDFVRVIHTDRGSEFNNETFKKWCTDKGIIHRMGLTKRHEQNSVVEGFNYIISKLLAVKTTMEQQDKLDKNEKLAPIREWQKYLTELRKVLNDKKVKVRLIKEFFTTKKVNKENMLKIGDIVHRRLDFPVNVHDKAEQGRFRTGDFRYERKPRKIIAIRHVPDGNPPRYVLEGIKNASYGKWELLKP